MYTQSSDGETFGSTLFFALVIAGMAVLVSGMFAMTAPNLSPAAAGATAPVHTAQTAGAGQA